MERTRRTDAPFGDGVDLDQLARAHRRVQELERARDRAVLRHAENITEAQRAEAAGNRRIEQSLRSYGLTRDRYDRIMALVRSDPVLHGILQEAVRGLSANVSGEGPH